MDPKAVLIGINAAIERQDWPLAAQGLRQLVVLQPHRAGLWIQLSYVESFLGHYRAARDAAIAASRLALEPGEVTDLITRLRTFNEAGVLHAIARDLLATHRADVPALLACTWQLSNMNDHDLALRCARAVVERAPDDVMARVARGQMLAQHGCIQDAEADFQWGLEKNPGSGAIWWALSGLRKQTSVSNHVGALNRLVGIKGQPPGNLAMAAFALHKELDDIGEYADAWHALEIACREKRSTMRYDMADSRALVDALVASPTVQGDAICKLQASARTPVFIVGMHRSGTTLLEQLLDASPQVRGVGELYDFTSAMRYATDHHCKGVIDRAIVERAKGVAFAEIGKRYLDGMAWRLGNEAFFTDKLPSNFLNIGFICRALPEAKILHMVRDPIETCFSNLREMFSEVNAYSYDQSELADYFIQYRRLMGHWHAAYPGRILDVDYAELTRDPEAVMRKVTAFCGIDYIDAMCDPRNSTRAVSTASVVQVRDRVVHREVPKWAPYAKHLQPLITALRQGGIELPDLPA